MDCPVCGYNMDPFDKVCPRCARLQAEGRMVPTLPQFSTAPAVETPRAILPVVPQTNLPVSAPISSLQIWAKIIAGYGIANSGPRLLSGLVCWLIGGLYLYASPSAPGFMDLMAEPLPFIIVVFPLLAVPEIIGSIGVLQQKRWGVHLTLFSYLLSTIAGIYLLSILHRALHGEGAYPILLTIFLLSIPLGIALTVVLLKAADEWEE